MSQVQVRTSTYRSSKSGKKTADYADAAEQGQDNGQPSDPPRPRPEEKEKEQRESSENPSGSKPPPGGNDPNPGNPGGPPGPPPDDSDSDDEEDEFNDTFVAQIVPDPQRRQKSVKIPDPPRYDGNRQTLDRWLMQLTIKLAGNSDQFPTEATGVAYAASLLTGDAADWIEPYIAGSKAGKIKTMSRFTHLLQKQFGDPDPQGTADRKLKQITQGKDDCATYHVRFARCANKLDRSDSDLISRFWDGLNKEIRDLLVTQGKLPKKFAPYAQLCIELDNRWRANRAKEGHRFHQDTGHARKSERHPKYIQEKTGFGRTIQRPNWNRPGFYRQDRIKESDRRTSNPRYLGSAPMDIDEINKLKKENKCFYCKKPGHQSKDCRQRAYDKQKGSYNKSNTQDKGKNREVQMFEKRTYDDMEEQKPTNHELEWIKKNRLQEGSCHLGFAPRTSDGRLRERFCDGHGVECSRTIPRQHEDKKPYQIQDLQGRPKKTPTRMLQISQLEKKPLAGKAGPRDGKALLQIIQEMAKKEDTWKEPGTSGRNINWGVGRGATQTNTNSKRRIKIQGISYSKNDLPHSYENPCTPNFCYKQGERDRNQAITGFTRKCEKICSPWNCIRCGNGRHTSTGMDGMLWNKCLDYSLCIDCLSDDEKPAFEERCQKQDQAIIRHCVNTGRICPTGRFHLDEIEEKATRLPEGHHKTKLLRNIRIHRRIQEEDADWNERILPPMKPAARFLVEGTRFVDNAEYCWTCYETKPLTLVSWDGRVRACEECAKEWTETMGIRQPWKELRVKTGSKN